MKACFVHETKFRKDREGNLYTSSSLSEKVWKRYTDIFDNFSIIARCVDIDLGKEEAEKKFNLFDISNKKFIETKSNNSIKNLFKNLKNTCKIIEDNVIDSDVIIARLPSFNGSLAVHYAKKYNKKYIVELVGCIWDSLWNYGNIKGKIAAPFMYFLTKKQVRHAKYVVYVTNEFLQKRYPTKGENTNCSNVILPKVYEESLKKRQKKILEMDEKSVICLGIMGSLNVCFKGHKEAIKAISRLNNNNIELHFLGAGNKEKWKDIAVSNGVNKKVYFDGTLSSGEPVMQWLDDIDIFLMPSLQEGLPRAMIEAMSRGCPIVGMKTGGIPELIDNKFICRRKDDKDLAKKIEIMLSDKNIMLEQASKNFNNSYNYLEEILNDRRRKFFLKVLEDEKGL